MKRGFLTSLFLALGLVVFSQVNVKRPEKVFDLLTGIWQYQNNPEFESWEKVNGNYVGKVFSTAKGDTVMSQQLTIFKENKTYFIELKVLLQPNLPIIKFQLAEATNNQFVFENKKESFPQSITYTFSDKTLSITQGGKINGKPQSISFVYTKIK